MKQLKLTVTTREGRGRGNARRLRAQGNIPAVIYGKSGSRSLSVDEKDFRMLMRAIRGSAALVELKDDKGEETWSLIQATQRNPVTDKFEHIDFQEIVRGEEMTAQIPVRTVGECFGVKNENAVLEIQLHTVEVSCLPRNLPEEIVVDVTELRAGDAIHISNLTPLEGVKFLGDEATAIIHVGGATKLTAEEVAEDEAEAAAEEEKAEAEK